jgi:hypothetical protein
MQNLIIYKHKLLYYIFEEISFGLNFNIIFVDDENSLNEIIKKLNSYLIVTNKKYFNISNFLILKSLPLSISKLIDKINIEFLRLQFNSQSQVKINNYTIDLNSREIIVHNTKLKLTEKEINTIIYLSKSNKAVCIDELQQIVWGYQTGIETHTVETHIYRLRKKILDVFNDNKFIVSKKNGYQIN